MTLSLLLALVTGSRTGRCRRAGTHDDLAVFGAALLCECVDSSLGMGYGTTLPPILLIAGFEPLAIVPAVLLSELMTGVAAGLLHHRDGNIDLPNDPRHRRTAALLAALSSIGALAAVILAVRLTGPWFGYAIVTIVLAMGEVTLATARRRIRYRAGGIPAIGAIAAFNQGLRDFVNGWRRPRTRHRGSGSSPLNGCKTSRRRRILWR